MNAPVFTRKRAVTRPVLSLKPGTPIYVFIQGSMHTGEKIDGGSEADRAKAPPTLMHVEDLSTRDSKIVICPKVLQGELDKNFPDETYVGKCFEISTIKPDEARGKKYNLIALYEMDDPYADERAAAKPAGKK